MNNGATNLSYDDGNINYENVEHRDRLDRLYAQWLMLRRKEKTPTIGYDLPSLSDAKDGLKSSFQRTANTQKI